MIRIMLYDILYKKNISQRELAEKTGFTAMYISRLVNQKSGSIELNKLEILCKILDVTPNDFFHFV